MTPERWREIVELFEAAVDWPEEDRERRLLERCGDDEDLRVAVSRMLAADGMVTPAAHAPPPAEPAAALGRYRLIERIGSGGFSEVYRAWDPELGREVAIKTSRSQRSDLRRRFEREAKIVGGLVHPNITVVHDFGVEGDTAYLVQELLDGRDLRQVIDEGPAAPLETRLRWLLDVARGLEHAHRHGVVHRDVKPSNLRLCADGRIKILDFGVASLLGEASRLTVAGSVVGTAAYMAPEQVRGDDVDIRADLYSFAAVAYELLTGEPVYQADSVPGLLYRILHERPKPLALHLPHAAPAPWVGTIERCLDPRPSRRPSGFAPVIEALATAGLSPTAAEASSTGGESTGLRRPAWTAGAVAALALAVLVVVWAGWWRQGTDEGPAVSPAASGATAVAGGTLVIDALPWAEVTAIHDATGRPLPRPPNPYTPLALPLPAGEYSVTLTYPGADPRRCSASVEPAASSRCSVRFVIVPAAAYWSGGMPSASPGSAP